jgi:hypothetical protein
MQPRRLLEEQTVASAAPVSERLEPAETESGKWERLPAAVVRSQVVPAQGQGLAHNQSTGSIGNTSSLTHPLAILPRDRHDREALSRFDAAKEAHGILRSEEPVRESAYLASKALGQSEQHDREALYRDNEIQATPSEIESRYEVEVNSKRSIQPSDDQE